MTDAAQLHRQLLETLTAGGSLRTRPWKEATASVLRHEFLQSGFFRRLDGAVPAAWEPVLNGDDDWLAACYQDESLITQIAGTIVPADIQGRIMREPTSSSTLPSLVVRMLEDLHVEPDSQVLEIGTGTGYSTALLCARLGEDHVTSIEYDADVAARARTALANQGMFPSLVTGDGLLGCDASAPYDRIIATCAVHTVPTAWIEQTKPGGLILTTIGGWLGASELARLTVHDDGTASGPVLGGKVNFMLARPHMPPPLGLLPDLNQGKERETVIGPDVLSHWAARFVVQSAAPHAQRLTMNREGSTEEVLVDVASGAWAALYDDNGRWIVRQDGPDNLWDSIEERLSNWHTAGTPALDEFTVTVTPEGQSLRW
ncbi:ATP-grasp peptide maturase system methyltransferase [Streptomyces sp. NPDC059618]|uniref:ATP-grasp peptide maturase system methyltransferase n=1 Tax=Streptomyces sp. NPDC059618 TaxID=3346887 RepID=UPI0036CC26F1